MVYNLWMTVRRGEPVSTAAPAVLQPAG
jgi:hypothetical protein